MTNHEVVQYLCYRDPRNPYFANLHGNEETPPTPRNNCYCDNCFHGRDELALEILRLRLREEVGV